MSFWDKLMRTRAENWVYCELEPRQVPQGGGTQAITVGETYVNVWLKSARVIDVRKGLTKFYGLVHSNINYLPYRQEAPVDVSVVTTPKMLHNIDPKNIDRVILINRCLLGPVVYSGGHLEIEVGLFSVEEADLVAPYLGLLESISDLAGVGFLKTALPFVAPIRDGVNALLTGKGDSILEIGLSKTFASLKPGFHVVMRAPKGSVDMKKLRLDPDDWTILGEDGKPVKDYPYLVFEVAGSVKRADWAAIPNLKRQYDLVKKSIVDGNAGEAQAAFSVFRRWVLASDDLIPADATLLVELVKKEMDTILGLPAPHNRSLIKVRALEDFSLYPG